MVWRRPGHKPLSEPMIVRLPTHICVTRTQLVKPSLRGVSVGRSNDKDGITWCVSLEKWWFGYYWVVWWLGEVMVRFYLCSVGKSNDPVIINDKLSSRSVLVGRSKDYVCSVGEITIGFFITWCVSWKRHWFVCVIIAQWVIWDKKWLGRFSAVYQLGEVMVRLSSRRVS